MGSFTAVRMVAGREISTRAKSRAFRITTVVMLVAVVGFILLLKLAGSDSGSQVGITPSAGALSAQVAAIGDSLGHSITVTTVDQAAGEEQVRTGDLDALVTGTPSAFSVTVETNLSSDLQAVFQSLARQIAFTEQVVRLGGDPAAIATAVEGASFGVTPLDPAEPFQTARLILGLISATLVYIALLIYGQLVAQGVVEEKSSRIVELLLTTLKPWQLMVGKVVGIGVVGLGQLLLTAVVGIGAGVALDVITFPASIAAGAAVWAIVWFLIGYTMYALIFAALASLVSRQEDVGGVVTGPLMLIVVPFVLATSVLPNDPTNPLFQVLSLIPFFSPTLMPVRMGFGVAPPWEVAVAVVGSLALIVFLVWLGGRMYRNAVMRTGSRVNLRDALFSK